MSIALVLGSGGHTTELLKIMSNLPDPSISSPSNHFVIYSSGDFLSLSKYSGLMKVAPAVVREIPRARRVGQSYFTSIFTTIYSLLMCSFIFLKKYPKLVK
jgi:beta-1,4-N-acetylglucosaminyltransferase